MPSATTTHSPESERAVLASLLLAPRILDDLVLDAGDFYDLTHRLLFDACVELHTEGRPVDVRTLQALLEDRGQLEQAGGVAYLATLDLDLPDLGRVETYAEIVRERAKRRRLVATGEQLARQAVQVGETWSSDELAAHFRRQLEDLEGGQGARSCFRAAELTGSVVGEARQRREERERTGEAVLGLQTGLSRLDGLLGGLHQGLYLLAGAPGQGKTTLALQWALHVARQAPVIYVTFENSSQNLLTKALCARAGVALRDVRRGYADPAALERAAEEMTGQLEHLVLVDGDSHLTVSRLRSLARQAQDQHRAERCLVVVDYLQLWAKRSRELRQLTDVRARVDALGGELIDLSRRLGSPVLALSSQSRAGGNYGRGGGEASLDSLKESGDLEYSADAVLFLTAREEQDQVGSAHQARRLTVAKHRLGPVGRVELMFDPARGLLREEELAY